MMRPGMRFYPGLSFWNGSQDINSGERVYAIVHECLEHGWDEVNFKGFFGKYRIRHVDAQLVGSLAKQQYQESEIVKKLQLQFSWLSLHENKLRIGIWWK